MGKWKEVKGRAPKLLLNQGPSEPCYATGVNLWSVWLVGYSAARRTLSSLRDDRRCWREKNTRPSSVLIGFRGRHYTVIIAVSMYRTGQKLCHVYNPTTSSNVDQVKVISFRR